MKIDNSRIESVAVDAVNTYISDRTRKLSGKLEKSDTGISVDGEIISFTDSERKVATFDGTIPVQVKGKKVDTISEKSARFGNFDVNTFKNFMKLDGVLVFLVEQVYEDGLIKEKQIFYKYLDNLELINIITNIQDSSQTFKSITLDKLNNDLDFDSIIHNIQINRRSSPMALTLHRETLANSGILSSSADDDLRMVLNNVSNQIRDSEFYDNRSSFLSQNIPLITNILKNDFVFDIEQAISISRPFLLDDKYELLQEDTKQLVIIFLTKIDNFNHEFSSAKMKLDKIKNIDPRIENFYYKEYSISHSTEMSLDEYSSNLEKIQFDKSYQKNLYIFFYKILNKSITKELIEESLNSFTDIDDIDDILFIVAQAYSSINLNLEAIKYYRKIRGLELAKIWSIYYFYQENILQALLSNDLDIREQFYIYKRELIQHQERLEAGKINIPYLSDLITGIETIENPEKFLSDNFGDSEVSDIFVCQALTKLEKFDDIISLLQEHNNKYKSPFLFFIFLSYERLNRYDRSLEEIHLLNSSNYSFESNQLYMITDFFISSIIHLGDIGIINKEMDWAENKLQFLPHHYVELYLYKIRSGYSIEEKEVNRLMQMSHLFENSIEAEAAMRFALEYQDMNISKKIWMLTRKIIPKVSTEIFCEKLYNIGDEESLYALIGNIQWAKSNNIDSNFLTLIELWTYLRLEQFKAVVSIIDSSNSNDHEILNLKLIAQINLKLKKDIDNLIEVGLKSDNNDFKLNAALAAIIFNVDATKGSQILLKLLFETNFEDKRALQNYVIGQFSSLKNLDDEKELSKIGNFKHYFYKLTNGNNSLKFISVPDSWNVDISENISVIKSKSREFRLLYNKKIGDNIRLFNSNYRIAEKLPLSRYVFRKHLHLFTGPIDSSSPIKNISVENNNLSEIEAFLKADNYNRQGLIDTMKDMNFTGLVDKVVAEDELVLFIQALFKDRDYTFNLGRFIDISLEEKFQMSLTSAVFLTEYGLQDILHYFTNTVIDKESLIKIDRILEDLLNSEVNIKKLSYLEGQVVLNERTEEQYDNQIEFLGKLDSLLKDIQINSDTTFVEPNFFKIFNYDSYNLQASIDNKRFFVVEDKSIQGLYNGISVMGLVHKYFTEINIDIDEYLTLLIKIYEDKNIIEFTQEQILQIAFMSKEKESTYRKFSEWNRKRINTIYQ